jgi:hypothetical protein
MSTDTIRGMLIDYAEGTLDRESRTAFEEQLRQSPALQRQLASIRSTFERLQQQEEPNLAGHYFNNFIPYLRQRIEQGERLSRFPIPSWLSPALAPVAVMVILASMVTMFFVLQPDTDETSYRNMIRYADHIEFDDASSFAASPLATLNDDLFASIYVTTEDPDDRSLFPDGLFSALILNEYAISADQIVTELHDQEIDLIVTQLTNRTVQ